MVAQLSPILEFIASFTLFKLLLTLFRLQESDGRICQFTRILRHDTIQCAVILMGCDILFELISAW